MPCITTSLRWLVSWIHKGFGERHVTNSSILGSKDFSSLILGSKDVFHGSLVSSSSFSWKYSSFTFRNAYRFLVVINICSSWEAESEILAIVRIWEIYFKPMIIFESILLVKRSCLTHGLVHGALTTPIFFNMKNEMKNRYKLKEILRKLKENIN